MCFYGIMAKNLGRAGEDAACDHLLHNGWRISFRNHREGHGELDIIARDPEGVLVFVEVKTLMGSDPEGLSPEDNFSRSKFRKISRACEMFVAKHPQEMDERLGWRIDLIAIPAKELGLTNLLKDCEIRHYINVHPG